MLLLAVAACTALTAVRWVRGWAWNPNLDGVRDRQPHDLDLVLRVAVWGVAAGVVGARIYHVITSWSEIPDPKWQGVFEVWKGGLGVWGGIALGVARRRLDRPPLRAQRPPLHGRGRAGAAARAGDRALGQLVEPGALRQADRPAVGPRDRRRQPAGAVPLRTDLPPDLPLRVRLRLDRRGRRDPRRLALPHPAAGALRALRRDLHVRAVLRGAAPRRSGPRDRAAAAERLDVDRGLRSARPRSSCGGSSCVRGRSVAGGCRSPRRWQFHAAASGPPASVLARWSCASSSWTSTPSRAPSTCS